MPAEMQAKLLRVLQERTVRPVGATKETPIDVRVITATHRNLEAELKTGNFREDLYYRLNVVQISLPPLRERENDILLLAQEFVNRAAISLRREVKGISAEAGELLLAYDWPGNVRQLQNCIERAVTLARFETITPEDLPENVHGYIAAAPQSGIRVDPQHISPLSVVERRYIEQVLKFTKNNKSQAARLLGMDRRTLYRKLETYERVAVSAE
jgi:two-component system response regulator HydG